MANPTWLICECNPNHPGATPGLLTLLWCGGCRKYICLKCGPGHKIVCLDPMTEEEEKEYQKAHRPVHGTGYGYDYQRLPDEDDDEE